MKKVDCFISAATANMSESLMQTLSDSQWINRVVILTGDASEDPGSYEKLALSGTRSTKSIRKIAREAEADYCLFVSEEIAIKPGQFFIERLVDVARDTNASMIYSDYSELKEGSEMPMAHPLIDYQSGSLRDDFDFGPVLFFNTAALKNAVHDFREDFNHAGLYQLRLKLSQESDLMHIPELLYTVEQKDSRSSGKKMFDYVDPKNREVQKEMEEAVTIHLREVGAYLEPAFKEVDFSGDQFSLTASVVIPVRNREKTIGDAIESVLKQKTDFDFNLLIVDNHSSDSTAEIIESYAKKHSQLIHIVPERKDLGIGGCWNRAVQDQRCGKFAVQLDSDDLYSDENTLQTIIEAFYKEKAAMIIGSYKMTNFVLEEIPPGIIDHREWTEENGRNNALRINGLGAPRAFYTPIIRELKVPDVSYGEDYAIGLAISRKYRIGRIYIPVYLCRRWDDNTDASLNISALNKNNHYKDWIRSVELAARIKLNKEKTLNT
jgi:hypothetical protein